MTKETLIKSMRTVPDFPIPGILFFDITSLFKNPECLHYMEEELYRLYKDKGITKVVGIESRGFVMASILAARLGAGFVPARKPGKLPAETLSESFGKEYGTDRIEIHTDAITPDDVVLIHDDFLATGGTAKAVYNLVQRFSPKATYINFIVEIANLQGRKVFDEGVEVETLIEVNE